MSPARSFRALLPAVMAALPKVSLGAVPHAWLAGPLKQALRAVSYALLAGSLFGGCAAVKPYEREKLADPIMDPESPVGKQKLERKFQSTREGSAGGGTGAGGGCGCAK